MSQYQGGPSNHDLTELFTEWLGKLALGLVYLGGFLLVAGGGFLFYYVFTATQMSPGLASQALGNIDIIEKVLIGGVVAFCIGTAVAWWGEQLLAPAQIFLAVVLFAAPNYLPLMTGNSSPDKVPARALDALHNGGLIAGIFAILVLTADVLLRVKERAEKGAKTDQLKYGKGIKQEDDRQNVFLGKCWQLPFCRKFVRERCPIFHSKRTCWKELVGCMCEEQVIRDAMENKVIPKDMVLASKMIPRNNKLNVAQKQERCKNCVIYNEHQRQKYKAWVPAVVIGFVVFYAVGHGPLIEVTNGIVASGSKAIGGLALHENNVKSNPFFSELLLGAVFLVAMSYAMKALEFAMFKLKI
jgi:hypothetical protein